MSAHDPLPLTYFSDLLCIYAYASEVRLAKLLEAHGARVRLQRRFCVTFGNTAAKIGEGWKEKGGWEGFADHVQEVAAGFPHLEVAPAIWRDVRPASSHAPHLFLKAVELACGRADYETATLALRHAFFVEARDISRGEVQRSVARAAGVDVGAAESRIDDGTAFAALAGDYEAAEAQKIQGSPTFVFPEGRQKLYGNVGFRIIEANVAELLRPRGPDEPTWC